MAKKDFHISEKYNFRHALLGLDRKKYEQVNPQHIHKVPVVNNQFEALPTADSRFKWQIICVDQGDHERAHAADDVRGMQAGNHVHKRTGRVDRKGRTNRIELHPTLVLHHDECNAEQESSNQQAAIP